MTKRQTIKKKHKKNEPSHITYLDKTNLCGFQMSPVLTTGEIEWVKPRDINEDFIKSYDDPSSDTGYILQVDL